ncbi:alpha/beta hydrolase [Streptomyces lydicus]|nr:alpha/beta hydrolase [Streptomyces lydicus]
MFPRESKRALAMAAVLALALTGASACTDRAGDAAPQGSAVAQTHRSTKEGTVGMAEFSAAPDRLPSCFRGAPGATAYRLPGSAGRGRLVTVGSGPHGVVFAPISWGDACEWAAEAKRLAAGGYHVVTFDWGGDRRRTVADATRLLRSRGTTSEAWVGGCLGGTLMLGMLTDRAARPAGVAGISPLASLGGYTAGSGTPYDGELLLLGTADDPLSDEGKLREVAHGFPKAEVTVLPGTLHAAEIFAGPHGEAARRSLDGFLGRTFAPAGG